MENREKRLPTPDSHVDGGNDAKTVVYNTKKDSNNRSRRKNTRKKKRENGGRNTTVKGRVLHYRSYWQVMSEDAFCMYICVTLSI